MAARDDPSPDPVRDHPRPLADPTDPTGARGFGGVAAGRARTVAAQAAGLVLARVDAHVLTEDETRPVRDAVTAVLGADLVAELAGIWQAAHKVADDDAGSLLELARRWCDLTAPTDTETQCRGRRRVRHR